MFADLDENGWIDPTAGGGEVIQIDHYYPFGMRMSGTSPALATAAMPNAYTYNGKEYQDELGLGWHDYGARMYDASIGRFFVQDRFAEKYYSMSPYQYAANNPILLVDINGDSVSFRSLLTGEIDDTHAIISLMSDLSTITGLGLTLNFVTGTLAESEQSSGISADGFGEGKAEGITAFRNLLNDEEKIFVNRIPDGGGSRGSGSTIYLDYQQVDGFMTELADQGMNPLTIGYGMTFLHEVLHTNGSKAFGFNKPFAHNSSPGYINDGAGPYSPGKVASTINRLYRVPNNLAERKTYGKITSNIPIVFRDSNGNMANVSGKGNPPASYRTVRLNSLLMTQYGSYFREKGRSYHMSGPFN